MSTISSLRELTMIKILLALYLLTVFSIQGQETTKRTDLQTIPDKSIVYITVPEIEGKKVALGKFNYIEIGGYTVSSVSKNIMVYLEEKDFSEENLKILFEYVSKQNLNPNYLTISVYTDIRQFNHCDAQPKSRVCVGVGISEQPERPDEYDYYQATYWRRKNREYFKYSQALKIDASQFKRVIIKNN